MAATVGSEELLLLRNALVEIRKTVGDIVSPEEIERWGRPRTSRLVVDVGMVWFQAAIGVGIFVVWPGAVTFILAWFIVGGAQHGLALVAHEGAHRLLVPRYGRLNDMLACWFSVSLFLCLPVCLSLSMCVCLSHCVSASVLCVYL